MIIIIIAIVVITIMIMTMVRNDNNDNNFFKNMYVCMTCVPMHTAVPTIIYARVSDYKNIYLLVWQEKIIRKWI